MVLSFFERLVEKIWDFDPISYPKPENDVEMLVNPDSPVGKYMGLKESTYIYSDEVARVAVLIGNRQYEEFKEGL